MYMYIYIICICIHVYNAHKQHMYIFVCVGSISLGPRRFVGFVVCALFRVRGKSGSCHFQFFPPLSPSVEENMFGNGFVHLTAQSKFTKATKQFCRSACAIWV